MIEIVNIEPTINNGMLFTECWIQSKMRLYETCNCI